MEDLEVLGQDSIVENKYIFLNELNEKFFDDIEKIQEKHKCNAECCYPPIWKHHDKHKYRNWNCGELLSCDKSCNKIRHDYIKQYKLWDKTYNKITWKDLYEFFTTVVAMTICIFVYIIAFIIVYISPIVLILLAVMSLVKQITIT